MQLDTLDRELWHHYAPAPRAHPTGAVFYKAYALPTLGQYVVAGYSIPLTGDNEGYMARFEHTPGGATTTAWEMRFLKFGFTESPNQYLLEANSTLTVADAGNPQTFGSGTDMLLTRFVGFPTVYPPPLCATPPQPNAVALVPPAAPDSLAVLDLGAAGGAYAQVLRWDYAWGDGTSSTRYAPGWARHHYPGGHPPTGTAVRVRLTNNLGCATTQDLYPWGGRPTATAAPAALATRLEVFPNPAGATATLRLPGLRPQPPVPAVVLDALGREVARFALPVRGGQVRQTLDLGGWPPGIYTLRLLPQEGPVTRRLVRE